MLTRHATGTRHVAGAAARGAAGWILFMFLAAAAFVAVLCIAVVVGAVVLTHLPTDTLPPARR